MGISHFQQWTEASAAERCTMVQTEVPCKDEEQQKARSTEFGKRGPGWIVLSTRGRVHMGKTVEEGPARNLVPAEVSVWHTPISCTTASVGASQRPEPKLYGKRGTMALILSECHVALTQGIQIQMPRWQIPAWVSWGAGGGEEKETTNRSETRTCTGWSNRATGHEHQGRNQC